MANKTLTKTMVGILLFATTVIMAPVAFALPTCVNLNKPEETKDWIVSILEEQITSPTKATGDAAKKALSADPNAAGVIDCLRVTKKDSKGQLQSEYAELSTSCPGDASCQRVQVFFAKSGTGLLFTYIGMIYRWAAGIIGGVSVLFLVWGGVEIATAGDNTGKIDEAKTRILQSLAGLALLFLSAVILYTINPNFFTL